MAINVFLIEQQSIIREGLTALMELDGNLVVVDSAPKFKPNIPNLDNKIDVLLIELEQTHKNVLSVIKDILNELPAIKIIILSGHDDTPEFLKEVFEAGVRGYMTKNASARELAYGIDKVTREGLYICTAFALKLINNSEINKDPKLLSPLHNTITEAEMSVLILVAEGLTNNDIAQKLFVSVRTIEMRRYKLLEKTNSINTASLIRYCFRTGLIR